MALTAEDINNVSFSIDRKGYDVDEVDVFLEKVAAEVGEMNNTIAELQFQLSEAREAAAAAAEAAPAVAAPEGDAEDVAVDEGAVVEAAAPAGEVAELQARIAELEVKLSEKVANDNAISQALIVAQRSADDIVANARAEATNIVKDADEEADRIIGKAESDRLKIAEAIRALENDRAEVRAEYRDMLSNFMADAQRKLAEVDGDTRRAAVSAQARYDANSSSYAGVASPSGTNDFTAPRPNPKPVPASASYVDKDFSGYGDAVDDFAFDVD